MLEFVCKNTKIRSTSVYILYLIDCLYSEYDVWNRQSYIPFPALLFAQSVFIWCHACTFLEYPTEMLWILVA